MNLNIFFTILMVCLFVEALVEDKQSTRTGTIKFVLKALLENIEATNLQVAIIIDKKLERCER